jgi:hypothetical protein
MILGLPVENVGEGVLLQGSQTTLIVDEVSLQPV